MKAAVICVVLLAASPLATAQSVDDPLGVEVAQPAEIIQIWEDFYNQQTMDAKVIDGVCVQTPMSMRQFFNIHRTK